MKLNRLWDRFALCLIVAVVASLSSCTGVQPAGQAASSAESGAGAGVDSGGQSFQRSPAAADVPRDRPLRVGFLVVDGVYNSELMAPYDVFHHTVFHVEPAMEVFTVSEDGEPITTFEGLEIEPHYSFANAPPIDILVVPSAEHSMDMDLVDHIYGEEVAKGIGQGLIIPWPPEAGTMPALVVGEE